MLNDSEDTEKIGWPIYIQYHRIIFFFTKGKSSTDNARLLCDTCMYRKSLIAQPLFFTMDFEKAFDFSYFFY